MRDSMVQNEINAWKIVLIDDEEDILEVTQLVLVDQGYTVKTATNGASGLILCRTFAPQLVITDIRMPGMDGLSVLASLKDSDPDIEVIVVTAFGDMDLAVQALQLDDSDFIPKPIAPKNLIIALERAKSRHKARAQLAEQARFLERENAKTTRELMKISSFRKNLLQNSMDGILACDTEGQIIVFNRSMERMTGYLPREVINKRSMDSFFSKEDLSYLRNALHGEEYWGKNRLFLSHLDLKGKAFHLIPVQVAASLLFDSDDPRGKEK